MGYSQPLWDRSLTTQIPAIKDIPMTTSSSSSTPPIPPLFHEPWSHLTAAQHDAAHTLGYTEQSWDDAFLDDNEPINSSDDEEEEYQENKQDDDERDDSHGNNGSRHHQSEFWRPQQSPNDARHTHNSMNEVMYDWNTEPPRTPTSFDDTTTHNECHHRRDGEDEFLEDISHDIYSGKKDGWIKVPGSKLVESDSAIEYKDGVDEDEFIANFLAVDILEPAATSCCQRGVENGICDDNGVGVDEFIANFLSEDTVMSTATTSTSVEIPRENLFLENVIDEDDCITNFLSGATYDKVPTACTIPCGPSNRSDDDIALNVNVDDDSDDDEKNEMKMTNHYAATLITNVESIDSPRHRTPDKNTTSSGSLTLSTVKHHSTDISDDLEAHESFPLLQGRPGIDTETTTAASMPVADSPMELNSGGLQILVRRSLLASNNTNKRGEVGTRENLSRQQRKNIEKFEDDKPAAFLHCRSHVRVVMILSVAIFASMSIWWIATLPRM